MVYTNCCNSFLDHQCHKVDPFDITFLWNHSNHWPECWFHSLNFRSPKWLTRMLNPWKRFSPEFTQVIGDNVDSIYMSSSIDYNIDCMLRAGTSQMIEYNVYPVLFTFEVLSLGPPRPLIRVFTPSNSVGSLKHKCQLSAKDGKNHLLQSNTNPILINISMTNKNTWCPVLS